MAEQYFFDTYALFEIVRASPEYQEYAALPGVTTIFNIAELNLILKKVLKEKEADALTEKAFENIVPVILSDIQKAMALKLKHKKFSIPDCVGYVIAQRLSLPFLTGDEDFRSFPQVRFVNTRLNEQNSS